MKKAFTLIELLVVIAIIAILAAILFPVFAQAKEAAKKTACLSNLKQIGTSTALYLNDYDDTYYAHRWNCGADPVTGSATQVCQDYTDGNGNLLPIAPDQSAYNSPVNERLYYVYTLYPYTKNYQIFKDPDTTNGFYPGSGIVVPYSKGTGAQNGNDYGGQNSYGHNDAWLSPAANTNGGSSIIPTPPNESSIPRISSTILLADAGYYGVGPDVTNASGLTDMSKLAAPGDGSTEAKWMNASGSQYTSYWANLGNGNWAQNGSNPLPLTQANSAPFLANVKTRHNGNLNVEWADTHAKSLNYTQAIGNICYWTTDIEGAHPNCG